MKKKILFVIILVVIAFFSFFIFMDENKKEIILVPDFNKKTYEEADKWCKINMLHCDLKKEYSDIKYGKLISQSLNPNHEIKDDEKIIIIYSDGNEATDVQEEIMKVAKKYSIKLYLSKEALKNELISLKYSEEDIEYALNHADIDYKENALKRAKEYQKIGVEEVTIYDNLISSLEGFTKEEADYAIKHLK